MHAFRHRFLSVAIALLSLAGWTATDPSPAAAAGGWSRPVAPDAQVQDETMVVHAPPLRAPAPAQGNPTAIISTLFGDITIELFKDRAPASVENFLQYVTDGFYAGTIFHRVMPGFMIQGGGYPATLVEKSTRPPIRNEATNGLRNLRATLGMARQASLRSATSQFYINVADNRSLDHTGYSPQEFGYAVFGRVLSGMDVADRIAAVPTATIGGMENVPVEPVVITSIVLRK